MKKHIIIVAAALSLAASTAALAQAVNTLTAAEKKQGWVLLFNGKDFDGWRQCNGTAMPANWVIEDQAMKVFTAPGKKPGQGSGGDILYGVKKFRNFELSIDWKTEKAGNSGIFFNVREVPGKPIYYAAPEVQVLDNVDATDNKIPSHLAGSLYDMLAADPKSVKPVGEWNTIVISVKDGKVTHTQNGMKVVEYTLWTPEWDEMVAEQQVQDVPRVHRGHRQGGLHRPPGPRLRHLVPEHQDQGAQVGSDPGLTLCLQGRTGGRWTDADSCGCLRPRARARWRRRQPSRTKRLAAAV